MKTLALRIYLSVLSVLLVYTVAAGYLFQQHLDTERTRVERTMNERLGALALLLQQSIAPASAPADKQAEDLLLWSERLLMPLAMDDAQGQRLATADSFVRHYLRNPADAFSLRLSDGRTLWIMRPLQPASTLIQVQGLGGVWWRGYNDQVASPESHPWIPESVRSVWGVAILMLGLFLAVVLTAWPMSGALTRRLQVLSQGMSDFGQGNLQRRVEIGGSDEVADVATSFNRAAQQVQDLLLSHKHLLANASHELRSPLARLKMAVTRLPTDTQAEVLKEIRANVRELDDLVEEVLLSSRLEATPGEARLVDDVDLLALSAEEGALVGAQLHWFGESVQESSPEENVAVLPRVIGDERLIRRAVRNLLQNAKRYGEGDIQIHLNPVTAGAGIWAWRLGVSDSGPGVPAAYRKTIFEPFFRMPGHAEKAGGVGLGLALVSQIALRHGGTVVCRDADGGGALFEITFPVDPRATET